jgi:hypothetical protein
MTILSIALFAHLVGMAALFVALAVEWMSVELLRSSLAASPPLLSLRLFRTLPRITGVAVLLILVSGAPLAAQLGVFRSGWVGVSFVAMVLMGALGGATLRPLMRRINAGSRSGGDTIPTWQDEASHAFLRSSLRMRVSVALGIVYLMVAKPDLLESMVSIGVALALGTAANVVGRRSTDPALSVQEGGERATSPAGGS